jgi:cytoskeletal protein CcmA (bactofilin family)
MAIFNRVFKGGDEQPATPQEESTRILKGPPPSPAASRSAPAQGPFTPSRQGPGPQGRAPEPAVRPAPGAAPVFDAEDEPSYASEASGGAHAATSARSDGSEKPTSRIGPTVVVEGEIRAEQDLIIEGNVRGEVVVQGDVTLEESARLEANIQARNLVIHGYLLGDVHVEDKVQIQPTGTMIGQLVAARLTVADGARFKGQIQMGPGAKSIPAPAVETPHAPAASLASELDEDELERQIDAELGSDEEDMDEEEQLVFESSEESLAREDESAPLD